MRPKKTPQEVEKEIQEIANYLMEKQELDYWMNESLYDKDSLITELESIFQKLIKASDAAAMLDTNFELDRMRKFYQLAPYIRMLHESTINARANAYCAINALQGMYTRQTRLLELQRSAVRLSFAYFEFEGRGVARKGAKRAMQLAGIEEPDESSITKWLKEFREESSRPLPKIEM